MTHDKLQAACLEWLWNYCPQTRYTATAICNEPPYPMGTGATHEFLQKVMRAIRIAMSNLMVLPGVLDFQWYWAGKLYIFDVKLGSDTLKKGQHAYIKAIEAQGGQHFIITSLEQFQHIAIQIITYGKA